MILNRLKLAQSLTLATLLYLPSFGQSNSVSTPIFQITFPSTWAYLTGQDSSTASETDSSAIRGSAGGLNGQALMAWLSTPGVFDISTLPQEVLVGGATGVFTKVKDSTATYGTRTFQIADFTYDSLSFPAGFIPLQVNPKGKMRVYATQAGDHHFVLALSSVLLGPNAKLPYADAESALKTLVLKTAGAGISRPNHTESLRFQAKAYRTLDVLGRTSNGTQILFRFQSP